jgi:hypothetical protein
MFFHMSGTRHEACIVNSNQPKKQKGPRYRQRPIRGAPTGGDPDWAPGSPRHAPAAVGGNPARLRLPDIYKRRQLGCEVMTAGNAIDALTMLRADHGIEMLLTDINMPGMNGYELAVRAQQDAAVSALPKGRQGPGLWMLLLAPIGCSPHFVRQF